jgi:hypothetical protein
MENQPSAAGVKSDKSVRVDAETGGSGQSGVHVHWGNAKYQLDELPSVLRNDVQTQELIQKKA